MLFWVKLMQKRLSASFYVGKTLQVVINCRYNTKRKDGCPASEWLTIMKLSRNELTMGNKAYKLADTEYAFMDTVSSICTVLCSAIAGADAEDGVEMNIPLAENEGTRFSAYIEGYDVKLYVNDDRIESGNIVDIVNSFVDSVLEAADGLADTVGSGMIGEDVESGIRDDIETLKESLEEMLRENE